MESSMEEESRDDTAEEERSRRNEARKETRVRNKAAAEEALKAEKERKERQVCSGYIDISSCASLCVV